MIRSLRWVRAFLAIEAASGLLLIVCAGLAVLIANSPFADGFAALIERSWNPGVPPVRVVVNDGLMSGFFLLVGLELKREMAEGALASRRRALLPVLAALGGMVVPALIYRLITVGYPALSPGWAIPVATDIAFALAVAGMLGRRVPHPLKVFLAALAIIDDLGAILIIAIFYTGPLDPVAVAAAVVAAGCLWGLNRARIGVLGAYIGVGLGLWVALYEAGIHPTLAGAITAMAIPLAPQKKAPGPLHRLEFLLHPWIAYGVMPIFGFVNAGVSLTVIGWTEPGDPLVLAIFLGLVLGKPLGIGLFVRLALALGFGRLPAGIGFMHVMGLASLCGIGFTMCLFIGYLAFPIAPDQMALVKLGVLLASSVSALAGVIFLWLAPPVPTSGKI